jgi:hypothetical protein
VPDSRLKTHGSGIKVYGSGIKVRAGERVIVRRLRTTTRPRARRRAKGVGSRVKGPWGRVVGWWWDLQRREIGGARLLHARRRRAVRVLPRVRGLRVEGGGLRVEG